MIELERTHHRPRIRSAFQNACNTSWIAAVGRLSGRGVLASTSNHDIGRDVEMTEPRPHRDALAPEQAAETLGQQASARPARR